MLQSQLSFQLAYRTCTSPKNIL